MPTKRYRRMRSRILQGQLTEFQRHSLLMAMPPGAFETPDDEREAWKQHAAVLVTQFVQWHGLFLRPFGWWRFDSAGPRYCLADPQHMILPGPLYGGMPSNYTRRPDPPGGPKFESTFAYLARHHLPLLQGEREAIAQGAADPHPEGVYQGQEQKSPEQWARWVAHVARVK